MNTIKTKTIDETFIGLIVSMEESNKDATGTHCIATPTSS